MTPGCMLSGRVFDEARFVSNSPWKLDAEQKHGCLATVHLAALLLSDADRDTGQSNRVHAWRYQPSEPRIPRDSESAWDELVKQQRLPGQQALPPAPPPSAATPPAVPATQPSAPRAASKT